MGGREDQERLAGIYLLERVDNLPIPAAIAPQQGCNRTVRKGNFTITPAGPDVVPMYDWTISIDTNCDPVPPGVLPGAGDVGSWRFGTARISFNSMLGHGSYDGVVEEPSGTPAIVFSHLGNAYRFVRVMRSDDPQGVVYVTVVDQFGQRVAGVGLIFTFANGLEGGGTTPESGEFGTGGVVGDCTIRIIPPAGYGVPASQPNPFTVRVVEGPSIRVQISLTKT